MLKWVTITYAEKKATCQTEDLSYQFLSDCQRLPALTCFVKKKKKKNIHKLLSNKKIMPAIKCLLPMSSASFNMFGIKKRICKIYVNIRHVQKRVEKS